MQLTAIMIRCVALACGLVALIAGAEQALAYPQFQFSTGNGRCTLCHFAPAGGGLIRSYGRDEAEGTISATPGDVRFLHGLWSPPDWLALGGDLRGAAVAKHSGDLPQYLAFPMQADLYIRAATGTFSAQITLGMSGAARGSSRPPLQRLASREHFLMWQADHETGLYARAGRFFAPYGLRLEDHTAYSRRYLGQHTLEETYGLSVGKVEDEWEVHATAFVPPSMLLGAFQHVGTPAMGAALYYERRARDDTAAWGAQSRLDIADESTTYWLGGVGKLWLEGPRLLFMSQLDLGLQTFDFDADPRARLSVHLGVTRVLAQGWYLNAAVERYQPDVALAGTARDSVKLSLQYFFRSHWEVMLLGKLDSQGLDTPDPMALLMLHYYL
jgi:hypothetical protein